MSDRRVFGTSNFYDDRYFSRMKKLMLKTMKMTGERRRILRSDLRITTPRTTLGLWFLNLLCPMIA